MGILVQNLIKRGCITIKENANIYELIETLNKNSIGCVVVISEEKKNLVGIISERDLIRNHKKIFKKNNVKVSDVMTKKIISCTINASSADIMETMTKNKIRHVPILHHQKLLGIVSIGDVVNRLIENYAQEAKHLKEYINS